MTDGKKLKSFMVLKGLTQDRVAEAIGISTTTFNMKINNKREFLANEIKGLIELLDIPKDQIYGIFFTNDVDYKSTSEDGTDEENDPVRLD